MTGAGQNQHGGRTLIGRGRELQELAAGILDAAAGTGGLFVVQGEPGIGKSRLVEAAAELAENNGVSVHWGRCWEAGGAPAYWPWIQILRSIEEKSGLSDLAMVPGAPLLGQLVPEFAGSLPAPGPESRLEPEQARFQLMDAVAGVVLATARRSPVVIVIEDLHSADPASLALFEFLARQIRREPVQLVGTTREGEARREGVGEALVRIALEARSTVRLGALTHDEVAACVHSVSGAEPDPRAVSAIHEASEGNPLFVFEIAGLMASRGQLVGTGERIDITVPDTIKAVIQERAGGLDPEDRELLEAASVLGREFAATDVAQLLGVGFEEVEDPLAHATTQYIVEELPDGRHRFVHILIREVFHAAIEMERRRELHLRWAERIEALHPGGSRTQWTEVAHHLLSAGPAVAARAADACVRAAEQAQEQLAFDDAAEFLGHALGLVDRSGKTETRRHCSLMLDHAQVLLKADRIDNGRQECLNAADEARRLDDPDLFARAALIYGSVFIYADVDRTLIELLQEALETVEGGDGAMRARLQARLAAALQPSEEPEEGFQMARDAIAMARRIEDPCVLLDTIRSGCSALMDLADPAERLALNREHVVLAEELGQPYDAFRGHMRIVIDAIELGDLAAADAAVHACDQIARQTSLPHHLWPVASFFALRATMNGRFEEAARWIDEAQRQAARVQDPNAARSIALQELGFYRAQESFEDMVAYQRQVQDAYSGSDFAGLFVWVASGSGFVRMERPDRVPADAVERGGKVALSYGDPSFMCLVSEIAAAPEYWETAELLWQRLQGKRDHWVSWGLFGMVVEGPVSRILALLASGLGRAGQAERHFQQALAQARAAGALPMVSRTAYEFARHLTRAGDGIFSDQICELLNEAEEIASGLGQKGLLDLIRLARGESTEGPAEGAGVPVVGFFGLERDGDLWTCSCGGESFTLKHTKGLRMLARLVAEPGREIHVLDLYGAIPEGSAVDGGDAGEVLDSTAKAQYQRRVEELRVEIDEAEGFNDSERASRAREELDAIATELSKAYGLGGRERRTGSAAERARVNVQRRLRDAVKRIARHSPAAGKHLDWALKTGMYCVYDPK